MTQPTHTHRQHGGRFAMLAHYNGDTALEAQMIVIYRDLDREIETATTAKDWEQNWKPIAADDCTLCLGTGTDAIKGNKRQPCGGCFGLGKVMKDGERPNDYWQIAEVALGIIQRQQRIIEQRDQVLAFPEVQEVLQQRKARQEKEPAEWVQREQEWRESGGRGHGGRRHTGD
ncbi:hypothetical protein [Halomonas organivorans]|uniref:Uncharacterized protein n=1 Tax=Halomonas organivorans TaxID=257772 RepID=A0A7W5C119_9GAMM|nr:hypothetical protein [Halomonas organivorans]